MPRSRRLGPVGLVVAMALLSLGATAQCRPIWNWRAGISQRDEGQRLGGIRLPEPRRSLRVDHTGSGDNRFPPRWSDITVDAP